jgi:hypothetical protein
MGGGGGISPISIISDLVFSGLAGGAVKASSAPASTSVDNSAELAVQEAEARRKADRKKAEAALLSKARQADRAEAASRDAVAETLGAPAVAASQLKARLGQ